MWWVFPVQAQRRKILMTSFLSKVHVDCCALSVRAEVISSQVLGGRKENCNKNLPHQRGHWDVGSVTKQKWTWVTGTFVFIRQLLSENVLPTQRGRGKDTNWHRVRLPPVMSQSQGQGLAPHAGLPHLFPHKWRLDSTEKMVTDAQRSWGLRPKSEIEHIKEERPKSFDFVF